MSDNPWQHLFQNVSNCIHTHLANFTGQPQKPSPSTSKNTLSSLSPSSSHLSSKIYPANRDTSSVQPKDVLNKGKSAAPLTKEELGRATWTFLHTLAAQYPEHPTRQQKKDVKELMAILSRMYPCQECADHFKEVIKVNPVQAGSHAEFSQWMCHVHNVVNRSLGKLVFPCERVDARWGKLECEQRECDLQGTTNFD
ncbi:ALR/ERV [Salix purpurea]|uniref:Sulfhydryl oxidase n=1 Tax=Salix purpurea TaxID=77065 RepID=A0A9Q0PQA1_SALPP|nr:ALR/ERV [Salix purpurea]